MKVAKGYKYKWTDVGISEFYKYIGLTFYMSVIKLNYIRDYWRPNKIFSVPFPATMMSGHRYSFISGIVKMSDPHKDQENDKKKGTPEHDSLFQAKPLLDTIRTACKSFYHPHRNIVMHEGMAATNGFRLFVLADACNGYTVDFVVYTAKHSRRMGRKVSYDFAMSLMNRSYLGSGYHVYTDSFYTSPKLCRDVYGQSFGACGPYREHKKNCPRNTSNALNKSSDRGAIRWIRDGPLVFVKWMDTEEVSVCSTIHTAYSGDTVQRTQRPKNGASATKTYPCPSPVVEYNKYMGSVDLSDQLIQYFTAQHKTIAWNGKLFLHFLDIAATNAYIIHNELASQRQQEALTHKAFMKELTAQLCGVSEKTSHKETPNTQVSCDHVPVPAASLSSDVRKRATPDQRQTCQLCRMNNGKKYNTPWKCKACDVSLCLQLDRNCFEEWHKRP
ncbi:uncharacterized protein LOC105912968 [Clupea harengus]|uniref:Uncharacterized protein LOC105912968 n=1 Tax=Clupea harengus TaxID=7950 RepID=A0A8M1KTR3_CLUHA|nr:uncharacterized protein LOC105912968 [Clupea harengus]